LTPQQDIETDAEWDEELFVSVAGGPPGPSTPWREMTKAMTCKTWGGPFLSIRERRLVTLAILAMASAPIELAVHLRAALLNGDLTSDDIDEFSYQLAMYGGWPRASRVQAIMPEIRAQLSLG
jgi:alkylhydroperoxidase/carboxymuconolactone decarboxylase family protein YurZ